jgi:E-phenylitaconyl-CoA hydratase
MAETDILFEIGSGVATITLNRPAKMNSLTSEMMARLGEIWDQVRDDDGVRVAVITGAGERAFCSGRDLMAGAPGGPEHHRDRRARGEEPEDTGLEHMVPVGLWKPVIAAVNGHCLAGGFGIALACDIRIASENAKLGTSSPNRGLVAGAGITQRLPRYLPFGIAMEMLLYGASIDATRALQYGLVNAVVPSSELMTVAHEWAQRLVENAPFAVRKTKEVAYRGGFEMTLQDGLRLESRFYNQALETDDVLEGARAFTERRKPHFQGR